MELNEIVIQEKIDNLEKELELYKTNQQKKIDEFMFSVGLTRYINEVSVEIASLTGKIDALKSLLKKDEENKVSD